MGNVFKKGKIIPVQKQTQKGERICESNSSIDTKVNEEGGRGGAPGARAKITLQPVVKTMVRQEVPLQCMEDLTQSRWMPKGSCDPVALE